jgi:long-chain acyl-CoA synthetase
VSPNGPVRVLRGDITLPQLGFDDETYAQLTRSTSEIIHCAADTRFGIAPDCASRVNVAGTQQVISFAAQCSQLQKFAYVSTVYVVGRSSGYFREELIQHENGFSNAYQQSKYQAEELVARATAIIPAAIFRLSSVIGESNGTVRQFNHVHRLIRLLPQNVLPVVPGRADAPIDLIAGDWAIRALAHLFESAFVPGRVYHLCAGSEHSLTLPDILKLTNSVFESHPRGRKFLPIKAPEFVPLARYEDFLAQRSRDGDRLFQELARVLGFFLPHLAIFQAFDNSETMRDLAPSGPEFPSTRECFERVVNYCLDTNWGKSPVGVTPSIPSRWQSA